MVVDEEAEVVVEDRGGADEPSRFAGDPQAAASVARLVRITVEITVEPLHVRRLTLTSLSGLSL